MREIYKNYSLSEGKKTLTKACGIASASSSTEEIAWFELTDQYKKFVPYSSDKT